jgi:hypothetical protein
MGSALIGARCTSSARPNRPDRAGWHPACSNGRCARSPSSLSRSRLRVSPAMEQPMVRTLSMMALSSSDHGTHAARSATVAGCRERSRCRIHGSNRRIQTCRRSCSFSTRRVVDMGTDFHPDPSEATVSKTLSNSFSPRFAPSNRTGTTPRSQRKARINSLTAPGTTTAATPTHGKHHPPYKTNEREFFPNRSSDNGAFPVCLSVRITRLR